MGLYKNYCKLVLGNGQIVGMLEDKLHMLDSILLGVVHSIFHSIVCRKLLKYTQ